MDVTIEKFLDIEKEIKTVNVGKIRAAFRLHDRDNMGYINVGMLKLILQSDPNELDDLEIEEIVSAMNPDGDGKINYEDFLNSED